MNVAAIAFHLMTQENHRREREERARREREAEEKRLKEMRDRASKNTGYRTR